MGVCAFGGDKNLTLLLEISISLKAECTQALLSVKVKKYQLIKSGLNLQPVGDIRFHSALILYKTQNQAISN